MTDLAAGDRVRWRSTRADAELARLQPDETPAYPIERTGTLVAAPMGRWVQIQFDDEAQPDSTLVELLTRIDNS